MELLVFLLGFICGLIFFFVLLGVIASKIKGQTSVREQILAEVEEIRKDKSPSAEELDQEEPKIQVLQMGGKTGIIDFPIVTETEFIIKREDLSKFNQFLRDNEYDQVFQNFECLIFSDFCVIRPRRPDGTDKIKGMVNNKQLFN
jgi:hypothetical protein